LVEKTINEFLDPNKPIRNGLEVNKVLQQLGLESTSGVNMDQLIQVLERLNIKKTGNTS
jgi:hypothetical protein